MTILIGEMLTREQCWLEYHANRDFEASYDAFEMGYHSVLGQNTCSWAIHIDEMSRGLCDISREEAFDLMEAHECEIQREHDRYAPPKETEEEAQAYFEFHHLKPVTPPYWQVCVAKIDAALA
jgi:hypothetical protein